MPLIQKTVYIREADIEKWNALPNKAEWISERLNNEDKAWREALKSGQIAQIDTGTRIVEVPTQPVQSMFDRNPQQCKHGNIIGTCVKGCK